MEPLRIKLLNERNEHVPAALRDLIPGKDLEQWQDSWRPWLAQTTQEDRSWDWVRKYLNLASLNFEHYAVECEDQLQGLMIIETDFHRSREEALNLVYVEFLAIAPWNRIELVRDRRFRLVGSHLARWAVVRSAELGYRHRIGLHALPQAEKFYREKIRMEDFGPDANVENLHYFEFDESAGRRFEEGF